MSDIFISYAREDQPKAKELAEIFARKKWSVWWDYKIRFGEKFDEVIQTELSSAKCVIVIWSRNSVASQWVREEADDAKNRGVLVPILIEDVNIPIGFRSVQTAQLMRWNGSLAHPELKRLFKEIAARINPNENNQTDVEDSAGIISELSYKISANWKRITVVLITLLLIGFIIRMGFFKSVISPTQSRDYTEQFVKAVEMLQSHGLEARVAGISTLGKIATDSESDYWKIIDVLITYVRQQTSITSEHVLGSSTSPCSRKLIDSDIAYVLPEDDIQAIMSVLKNRAWARESDEKQIIYLESVCLRKVDLAGAYLKRASFQGSELKGANLSSANLENAQLDYAQLSYANLNGANLKGADLKKAVLTQAQLKEANLEGATLIAADLKGVDLSEVVGLSQEQVDLARTNENTKLPPGLHLPSENEQ